MSTPNHTLFFPPLEALPMLALECLGDHRRRTRAVKEVSGWQA